MSELRKKPPQVQALEPKSLRTCSFFHRDPERTKLLGTDQAGGRSSRRRSRRLQWWVERCVSECAARHGVALSLRNSTRNRLWRCSFSATQRGKETDTIQVKNMTPSSRRELESLVCCAFHYPCTPLCTCSIETAAAMEWETGFYCR